MSDRSMTGSGAELWLAGQRYLDCASPALPLGHAPAALAGTLALTLTQPGRLLHGLDAEDPAAGVFARLAKGLPGGAGAWGGMPTASGSEAADLALQLAIASTGNSGIISIAGAGHGTTLALSALNPHRPGTLSTGHLRRIPAPSSTQPLGGSLEAQPEAFARNLHRAIVDLQDIGCGVAALILDPLFTMAGLPELPTGTLAPAMAMLRRARALVISDERAGGLGRIGPDFWAHRRAGIAPDILVLGEALGNGLPVAGMMAKAEAMAEFLASGGLAPGPSPFMLAAARAVLDLAEAGSLASGAGTTGAGLLADLRRLKHPRLLPPMGAGLLLALELRREGQPDPEGARLLLAGLKAQGILALSATAAMGFDAAPAGAGNGASGMVLLAPPLCLTPEQAGEVAGAVAAALADLPG